MPELIDITARKHGGFQHHAKADGLSDIGIYLGFDKDIDVSFPAGGQMVCDTGATLSVFRWNAVVKLEDAVRVTVCGEVFCGTADESAASNPPTTIQVDSKRQLDVVDWEIEDFGPGRPMRCRVTGILGRRGDANNQR